MARKIVSIILAVLMLFSPLSVFAESVQTGRESQGTVQEVVESTPTAENSLDNEQPITPTAEANSDVEQTEESTKPEKEEVSPATTPLPSLTTENVEEALASPTSEVPAEDSEDSTIDAQFISQDGDFGYKTYDEGTKAIITHYKGTHKDVVIPATVDGITVVSVESLWTPVNIETLVISEGITSISTYWSDRKLKSMTLPSTLKNTDLQFSGCQLTDLLGLAKVKSLNSLILEECSALSDISALSELTNLTTLKIKDCPNIQDYSVLKKLTSLTTLSISGTNQLNTVDGIGKLTKLRRLSLLDMDSQTPINYAPLGKLADLQELNLTDMQLTNIDFVENLSDLTKVNLWGCSNLSDVSALKNLENLSMVYLNGTKVSDVDAQALLKKPDDIILYSGNSTTDLLLKPFVCTDKISEYSYGLAFDDEKIAEFYGKNYIHCLKGGTTTAHLLWGDQDTGITFTVTCIDEEPEADQPVEEKADTLPTFVEPVYSEMPEKQQIWGQYSDGSLWNLTNETPALIMDNVKSTVGAQIYDRAGNAKSWAFITDQDDTLWTGEIEKDGAVTLNKRVANSVKAVAVASEDGKTQLGYALDKDGNLWQLNDDGNILKSANQKIDSDVSDIMSYSTGYGDRWIGYIKNNGDLYIKALNVHNPQYKTIKVDTDVEGFYGENGYKKTNGTVYQISFGFKENEENNTQDAWKIKSKEMKELYQVKVIKSFYIKANNTTIYWYWDSNSHEDIEVRAFDFAATAGEPGRKIRDTEGKITEEYGLISNAQGELWEIKIENTKTPITKKISNSFIKFTDDGYLLSDGNYYNVNHEVVNTDVKDTVRFNSNEYILKNSGIVYFNEVAILNHVEAFGNTPFYDARTGSYTIPLYLVRDDGSLWYLPLNGELKPYKKTDCLNQMAVTGVQLSETTMRVTEGYTKALGATVAPENATNKNITWKSDKTDIATVDSNGVVTGKKAGTAKITVTTEDGGKTASCTVTVTAAAPKVDETTKEVSGIIVGETGGDLTQGLKDAQIIGNNETVSFKTADGQAVDAGAKMATGMQALLPGGKTLTLVLTGDNNGDAAIDVMDMLAIQDDILGKTPLGGSYKTASYINGDTTIDVMDMLGIQDDILGKEKINPFK